jgi:hypothetical protein
MRDRVAEADVIAPDGTALWVSTVKLPFATSWPIPYEYETMVFARVDSGVDWSGLHSERYETEAEAAAGHADVVARATAGEFTTTPHAETQGET